VNATWSYRHWRLTAPVTCRPNTNSLRPASSSSSSSSSLLVLFLSILLRLILFLARFESEFLRPASPSRFASTAHPSARRRGASVDSSTRPRHVSAFMLEWSHSSNPTPCHRLLLPNFLLPPRTDPLLSQCSTFYSATLLPTLSVLLLPCLPLPESTLI
jgi:hypothetical protein